jgi:hypothetical protein
LGVGVKTFRILQTLKGPSGSTQQNLKKTLLGGYHKESEFQNSEYEVDQVGLKYSGSQNKFHLSSF